MGTYLLTGGTRGIGRATAENLAAQGHRMLLLVRNTEAGEAVCAGLSTPGRVIRCDLAVPDELDAVVLGERLHGIVHVAGVLNARRVPAAGGVDLTWAANFLGPARLTQRLLPDLPDGATISFVSGQLHKRFPLTPARFGKSGGLRAAAEVTTAKILWIKALARAHPRLNISTFCPGRVQTDLHRALPIGARQLVGLIMTTGMSPEAAAPPIVDRVLGQCETGSFGVEGRVAVPAAHTLDPELQDRMLAYAASWPVTAG